MLRKCFRSRESRAERKTLQTSSGCDATVGALVFRIGPIRFGALCCAYIIRNPQNGIGNYVGFYIMQSTSAVRNLLHPPVAILTKQPASSPNFPTRTQSLIPCRGTRRLQCYGQYAGSSSKHWARWVQGSKAFNSLSSGHDIQAADHYLVKMQER